MKDNVFRANQYDGLVAYLKDQGVHTVHMTNGAFARDNADKPHQVSATMLAGFEALRANMPQDASGHAFLVAVNSPYSDKVEYHHEQPAEEQERLNRFLPYLESQFQDDVPVVAAFFDEASAMPVHRALHAAGIYVAHEFKFFWGIGTAGAIVTHENTQAIAYPYADQTVPVNAGRGAWDGGSTEAERIAKWGVSAREAHAAKGDVTIVMLHHSHPGLEDGRFGEEVEYLPLLSADDKPLFPLKNGLVLPGLEDCEAPTPQEPGL